MVFFQKERELKTRLYTDYVGKAQLQESSAKPLTNSEQYSKQRFSHRIGLLIPESPQALHRVQFEWLEMAAPEHLGPPAAMTTIVSNQRTSNITAHVLTGAFSLPTPDDSVSFLKRNDDSGGLTVVQSRQLPLNKNVFAQVFDYLRRRYDFMQYAYKDGVDAMRGRMRCRARRREHQKRGPCHDHINEWPEECGIVPTPQVVQMDKTIAVTSTVPLVQPQCMSVSRHCLRADGLCRLAQDKDGASYHVNSHIAEATAEMCRPYPLGSFTSGPGAPADLRGRDWSATVSALNTNFWNTRRLATEKGAICNTTETSVSVQGTGMFVLSNKMVHGQKPLK